MSNIATNESDYEGFVAMLLGCILSSNLSICFSRGTRSSRHRQVYIVLTQWASSSSNWPEAHTRRDLSVWDPGEDSGLRLRTFRARTLRLV